MKRLKNTKISSIVFRSVLGFTLLVFITLGTLYAYFEVRQFNQDAENSRQRFIENQKMLVKNQTEKVANYITYAEQNVESDMKDHIKMQVYDAWKIATNIWEENKNTLPKSKIKKLVKDALRPIRYYNDRGYIFMVGMDGVEHLFPVMPHLEGTNLLDLQDSKGNFVIQHEIEIIKNHNEGFLTDYWSKPGEDTGLIYPKTSFVKYFEPFDWYIGGGEYLDNVVQDVQKQVIDYIREISFGKDGYIFVNTLDGYAVVIDSDKYGPGDYVKDITDPNGVKVIEEEIRAAKTENGDFIYYSWKKPNDTIPSPKISFIKGIPQWNWLIGAGVYIDEIDEQQAIEKELLYKRLTNQLIIRTLLIIIILFIIILATRRTSKIIDINIQNFLHNLKQAVINSRSIPDKEFYLTELQIAAKEINKIVDQKRITENKLKESEIRFRTIFENVPVLLAIVDNNQEIVLTNKMLETIFELDETQKPSTELLQQKITENSVTSNFNSIFNKREGVFHEFEFEYHKTKIYQNWTQFKTSENENIIVGYDVTQLKNNETELKELNATKDKFFSIIAHDLRNPFNAILNITEILSSEYHSFTDERRKHFIDEIHYSTEITFNLLQNLLTWARSQQGRIQVKKATFPIFELIEEVTETYSTLAKDKEIELKIEADESIKWQADIDIMSIIISNLVNNAIKFSHMYSDVIIKCETIDKENLLHVIDNGVGIDKNRIDTIFEVEKVKSTKGTDNEKGTGLGLMLCKELTALNNGYITVKSEVGSGSTFTIHIPA